MEAQIYRNDALPWWCDLSADVLVFCDILASVEVFCDIS